MADNYELIKPWRAPLLRWSKQYLKNKDSTSITPQRGRIESYIFQNENSQILADIVYKIGEDIN